MTEGCRDDMHYNIGQDGVTSLRTVRLTTAVNGSPVLWYTHLDDALQRRLS
jgi:hypothetical protein